MDDFSRRASSEGTSGRGGNIDLLCVNAVGPPGLTGLYGKKRAESLGGGVAGGRRGGGGGQGSHSRPRGLGLAPSVRT